MVVAALLLLRIGIAVRANKGYNNNKKRYTTKNEEEVRSRGQQRR